MLREDKGKFDIVISDVHMPTMEEGFKLLETVGLEMKLPVISTYITYIFETLASDMRINCISN